MAHHFMECRRIVGSPKLTSRPLSITAAIVQQQDTALPRLRCRCNSGWPHHFGMPTTRRHSMPPWPTQKGACLVNRSMWVRNPPEAPFQHSLHGVTAAFLVVNETVPGQNRLREPFINRVQGEEAEPVVCKSTLPGASPGRTSTLLPRCKSHAHCRAKAEARGASPRGSASSTLVCSSTVRASGS